MTVLSAQPAAGITGRITAWLATLPPRRRERVEDGTLAAAIAVVYVASVLPYHAILHPLWLAVVLAVLQCVPLTWRRSRPVLMLCAAVIPRMVFDLRDPVHDPLPIALAIGMATVMERSSAVNRWSTVIITAGVVTWSQTQPGHDEPYDAAVLALIFGAAFMVGALSRTRRAALQAQASRAEAAEAKVDELAERAARAAAAERIRIARELHDIVSHHVSLMAVQSEAAGSLLPDHPAEAARSVDLIGQTARLAMTELRRLLGVLRDAGPGDTPVSPGEQAAGPRASLSRVDEVLENVRSAGLPVTFQALGESRPLSPAVDLTCYRIVQEALTNTMRHAPGASAEVEIAYEDEFVNVRVADSGSRRGGEADGRARVRYGSPDGEPGTSGRSSASGTGAGRGFGLSGITERVYSCGGTLTVGPRATGGFAVVARLPVQ